MVDFVGVSISVLSFFGISAIIALSLNLEYGFGGQPNLGKVLFFALGAFTGGLVYANLLPMLAGASTGEVCSVNALISRLDLVQRFPVHAVGVFVLGLVTATLVGGLFGYLASYPALRVREEWYLGMILLVAGEILRVIARSDNRIVCGYNGLAGVSNPFIWVGDANIAGGLYTGVILAFAAAAYFLLQKLAFSPYGRALKAMRDDRVAAQTLGKNTTRLRAEVLIVGSALTGLAGALYAHYIGFVTPDDFLPIRTFDIWVMIVLGGMANNRGTIVGAAVMTAIDRGSAILATTSQLAVQTPLEWSYIRFIFVGILLISLLLFRQRGLIPEQPVRTPAYSVLSKWKQSSK